MLSESYFSKTEFIFTNSSSLDLALESRRCLSAPGGGFGVLLALSSSLAPPHHRLSTPNHLLPSYINRSRRFLRHYQHSAFQLHSEHTKKLLIKKVCLERWKITTKMIPSRQRKKNYNSFFITWKTSDFWFFQILSEYFKIFTELIS